MLPSAELRKQRRELSRGVKVRVVLSVHVASIRNEYMCFVIQPVEQLILRKGKE